MVNRLERNQRIKSKGFNIPVVSEQDNIQAEAIRQDGTIDFTKIRVGAKMLTDATIELGDFKKVNSRMADKSFILRAINSGDLAEMRRISDFYYRSSGIYQRLCKYLAYMYRYDWMIVPHIHSNKMNGDKIRDTWTKALDYCDDFELKRFFGEVALKVIRHGCYYGFGFESNGQYQVQELPPKYCRSRFAVHGVPAVEFNMRFFDDYYTDTTLRMRILDLFPPDFKKGYQLYKRGKLIPEFPGDTSGWYLLDIGSTIKFNLNGEDFPALISVIPAIIDLDNAQGLDRKKLEQQLLKIIIQKMPIDKNGDLVFDIDEAQALHNNAVRMLGKAVGIDVLTTFAEVEVADMAEKSNTTTDDTMTRTKQAVFDQAGISQLQFNSEGNIALTNSILNDEASMYPLIMQFEAFMNKALLKKFNVNKKKVCFKAQILTTTIYNYKELAKLYKEQMQLGYSKFLSQIALGQSQSSIMASAIFENDILDLVNVFIPPLMSSTMNGDVLTQRKNDSSAKEGSGSKGDNGVGRKELDDTQKSDKTIANREAMGMGGQ